ncbi:MAG: Nitrilase/cyanide hydratase and apolipoprotein N-acyltransferase [Solirubrobacterales bacterium]|jgi:aliphatic nitrilase|nr:Nitrilase/cyanide hydratase and apolipoprotein N-acyltransferase [Solirubrobacterales bacterium]
MGDAYPTIRAAAIQAASVFLDREASTEKACALIREAGAGGARLVGLPEGFVPAHPIWFHFHPGTGRQATQLSVELFKNAVEIPGPEIDELCRAAADAGVYAVVGVCEKRPHTLGTLFNTQVFVGPDGAYLGKHQKLMPTVGERLVHMGGHGDTLGAFETEFGPASALICGENSNPLAIFALTAEHPRVHVMSWPNHFPTVGPVLRERVRIDSQAFAQMSKAYVVSACGTVDEPTIERLELSADDAAAIRDPKFCGGSLIVAPDSQVIAGPLGAEEAILYADLDLEAAIRMKLRHDFAGHYNRPDVFQLRVNGRAPQIFEVETGAPDERQLSVPGLEQQRLDDGLAPRLLGEGEGAERPPS